jgi:predicted PurR-regulated permease PerM
MVGVDVRARVAVLGDSIRRKVVYGVRVRLNRPENMGISRQLAVTVAIVGLCLVLVAFLWAVVSDRVSETTLLTFVGLFGTTMATLVASLKATETADTAAKTYQTTQLTASQNAAMQQQLMAHCGEMCPLDSCPLRVGGG